MNMLLYAPGVLLVLLIGTGLAETLVCLTVCATLQLALGFPFLSTYPIEYLKNSFDLGRVFTFKWTVNLKFLSEEIFTSKELSLALLVLTLLGKRVLLAMYTSVVTDTSGCVAFGTFAVKWIAEVCFCPEYTRRIMIWCRVRLWSPRAVVRASVFYWVSSYPCVYIT